MRSGFFVNPRQRSTKVPIPANTPCGYCFSRWATVWDHLMPYAHGGRTTQGNLYPSCYRCNMMLGHKIFVSIEEKREYARTTLITAGQWSPALAGLPDVQGIVSETSKRPDILFPEVQARGLDEKTPSQEQMPNLSKDFREEKTSAILLVKVPMAGLVQPKIVRNRGYCRKSLAQRKCDLCGEIFAPVREMPSRFDDRPCERPECGKTYTPVREAQRYCSKDCRKLHWFVREEQAQYDRPAFRRQVKAWLQSVPYRNSTFAIIRQVVCSRIAQRQKPRTPGKKKRKPS